VVAGDAVRGADPVARRSRQRFANLENKHIEQPSDERLLGWIGQTAGAGAKRQNMFKPLKLTHSKILPIRHHANQRDGYFRNTIRGEDLSSPPSKGRAPEYGGATTLRDRH
jgi:hypothetical protein